VGRFAVLIAPGQFGVGDPEVGAGCGAGWWPGGAQVGAFGLQAPLDGAVGTIEGGGELADRFPVVVAAGQLGSLV
jgi:hypothetical protein